MVLNILYKLCSLRKNNFIYTHQQAIKSIIFVLLGDLEPFVVCCMLDNRSERVSMQNIVLCQIRRFLRRTRMSGILLYKQDQAYEDQSNRKS